MSIQANIVDVLNKNIFEGKISITENKISSIEQIAAEVNLALPFITPGFIDSHVHIESSMLTPSQFARMAVVHGTVVTISDPHEIANVCGMQGVEYMIADGKQVPFHFYFGTPSCVPATTFETAGATITVADIDTLLQKEEIKYLAEMMNFPGVLYNDEEVMAKIALAKKYKKPIDGHAPGLRGEVAMTYIERINLYNDPKASPWGRFGGASDHECFTYEEALEKLQYGMKILIREGSAAKNFDALIPLLNDWEDAIMFCSDDKHPDSLELGHINQLCQRAVAKGIDIFKVLKAACINPIQHYNLEVGNLTVGANADFIILENLEDFHVLQTYINGILVAENGKSLVTTTPSSILNNFNCAKIEKDELAVTTNETSFNTIAIEALDGQLITNKYPVSLLVQNGIVQNDIENDILKIVVVNRYNKAPIAKAFIKNFGLQHGAIASSVAHDSHNIVAVGVDDASLQEAINLVIEHKGGLSYSNGNDTAILPLPIAGLMTNEDGYKVAAQYTAMDNYVKQVMKSRIQSPYMTLSFMALLVIPHLKLSDKGLFDGDNFSFA